MTATPTNLRALTAQQILELHWSDGTVDRFPFKFLRAQCPCASCVDEFTGRRMLDPATIPEDVQPTNLDLVGNYAVKIAWTDGHDTGLYRWEYLAWLAEKNQEVGREPNGDDN